MAMELLDNYSKIIKDDYLQFKNSIIKYSKLYFSQLYDDFDKKTDDYFNKMRRFINEVNEGKYSDKFNFGDLTLQKYYVYSYLYANIIFTKYLYELEQDANKKESLLSLLIELFNLRKKLIKEYEIFYLFIDKPENKNIKDELINNLSLGDLNTYSSIEYLISLKSNIVSINIFDMISGIIDFSQYVITKNYYDKLKDFYFRNKKYIYTYYYVNDEGEFITTNIFDDTSEEEKIKLIKIAKNLDDSIAFNFKNYIFFSVNKIESLFIGNINQIIKSLVYYKIENDFIKFPHFSVLNVLLHEFNHFALSNIFDLEDNIKNDKIDSNVLYMANMIANNEVFNKDINNSILGGDIASYIHELISYYINSKLVRDKIYYYSKELSYILSSITNESYINFVNIVTNLFDDSNKYLACFDILQKNTFDEEIPSEYIKLEEDILINYYDNENNIINEIVLNKNNYVKEERIDIVAKTDVKIVKFKDMLYNFDDKDNNYNNLISGESSIKDIYCVDCFLFTNSYNWKTQIRSDFNQKEAIYNWLTNSITLKLNKGLDTEFDLIVPIAIIYENKIKYSPIVFNKNINDLIEYLKRNFSDIKKEDAVLLLKYKLNDILKGLETYNNQKIDYDDEYINSIAYKYYDIITLTLDKLNKPIIDFKNAKRYSERLNEMLSITEEDNKEYYERFVKNYNYLSNVEKYKLLTEYREIKEKNIPYLMITNSSILNSIEINDIFNTDDVSLKDKFPTNRNNFENVYFHFIKNKIIFYDTSYYTKDTSSIYNNLSIGIRKGKDEDANAMAINSATKDVEYLNELLNEFVKQLDDETKENLSLKYNNYIFNSINGDYEKIPIAFTHSLYFKSEISKGSNKYRILKLNVAQQRGIRKAILNGDYALAHEVGVGKTIEAIAVTMMNIELYNSRKITIIVPVKVYEKWEKEILGIYNDNKKNGEIGYVFFGVLSGVDNIVLTKLGNLNEDEIIDKIYVLPDDKKNLLKINERSKSLVNKIIDTIINFDYKFDDNKNILYELSKSKYLYKLGSYNPDVHYSNIYKVKLSEDNKQKFLDIIKNELFAYNNIAKNKIETDKIFNENNELQFNYIYDCILKSNEQLLNIFNIFNKDENKYDKLHEVVKSIFNTIHAHINSNYKYNSKKDFYYVEKISLLKDTLYNDYMITDNIFEHILQIFVYVQLINNKDLLFDYIRKVSLDSDNKRNKEILDKWNKRAKKLGIGENRDEYFLKRYEIFDLEDFELKYFTEGVLSMSEKTINDIIDFIMLYSLYRYRYYLYKTYGEYIVYKDNSKIYINLIKDSGISNMGVGSIDFIEFINKNRRILTRSGVLNDVNSMYLENENKIINFTSLKSDIIIYDEAHKYNKYVKNLEFNVFNNPLSNGISSSMIDNTTTFEIFDRINSNIKLSSFRKASFKVFLLNYINHKYNYYYKGKKSYNLVLTATPFKNNVLEIIGFLGLVNSKFLSEISFRNLYSFGSMFFDTKFINEVSGTAQIKLVPSVEKISNPSIFNQILGCYVDLLSAEGVVKRPKKLTIPFNANEYPILPNNLDINIIGNKLRPTILQQVLLDAIIDIVNELHDLTDNAAINLKFDSIYNDIASIANNAGNNDEQTRELISLLNKDFDLRYLYNFSNEEEKNSFKQTVLNFISIIKDLILDYYVFAGVEIKNYTYINNKDRYINVLNALKEFYRNNDDKTLENFIFINKDITKYVKRDLVAIKRYINMLAMVGTRYVSLSPAIFNFINIPLYFKPNNDEDNLTDYEKSMLELKDRIIYYIDKLNMYEYKINGFKYFNQDSIRNIIDEGDKKYYEFVINSSNKLRYVVNSIKELYEFAKINNIDKKGIVLYLNLGLSAGNYDIYRITDTSVSKSIIDYILNNNIVSSKSFLEKVKYNENDDEENENENNKKSSKDEVSLKEIEELIGSTNNKKREAIIQAFNEGRVKIVVTSVKEAVDLNGNTIALFNLSVDWNYTDNVQIEGRVHRQGNRNGYVTIVYPCIYNSGDVIMWEKLYQKKNRYKNINIYDLTQVTSIKDDDKIDEVSSIEDMVSSVSMLSKYIFVKSVTDAISRYSTICSNINNYEKILNVLLNYDYAYLNLKYKYFLMRDIMYYDMFYSKLFTKNRDIEFISNNYIQNKSTLENSINRLKKQIEKYFTFLNDNNLIKLNKKEYDYDSIMSEYKKLLDDFVSLINKYRDESSTTIPLLNKRGINIELNKIYEIIVDEYNKGEEYEKVIKNKILSYIVSANNNDENKFNIDKYMDFVYDLSNIIYDIILKHSEINKFSEQYKDLVPVFSNDFLKTIIDKNDIDIQKIKNDFVDGLTIAIEKEKDSRNILNKFIDDFIEYIKNYNQMKNINDKIININKNIELYKQKLSNENNVNIQNEEQIKLELDIENDKENVIGTEGNVISIKNELKETKEMIENKLSSYNKELEKYTNLLNDVNNENTKQRNYLVGEYGEYFDIINKTAKEFGKILKEKLNNDKPNEDYINNKENEFNEIKFTTEENIKEYIRANNSIENFKNRIDDVKNEFNNILLSQLDLLNKNYEIIINENYNDSETKIKLHVNSNYYFIFEGNRFDIAKLHTIASNNLVINQTYETNKKFLTYQYYVISRSLIAFKNVVNELRNKDDRFRDKYNDIDIFVNTAIDIIKNEIQNILFNENNSPLSFNKVGEDYLIDKIYEKMPKDITNYFAYLECDYSKLNAIEKLDKNDITILNDSNYILSYYILSYIFKNKIDIDIRTINLSYKYFKNYETLNEHVNSLILERQELLDKYKFLENVDTRENVDYVDLSKLAINTINIDVVKEYMKIAIDKIENNYMSGETYESMKEKTVKLLSYIYNIPADIDEYVDYDIISDDKEKEEVIEDDGIGAITAEITDKEIVEDNKERVEIIDNNEIIENIKKEEESNIKMEDDILRNLSKINELLDKYNNLYSSIKNNKNKSLINSVKSKISILNLYNFSLKNENIKYNYIKNNDKIIIDNLSKYENYINMIYKMYVKN